jgi:hypothetical protein
MGLHGLLQEYLYFNKGVISKPGRCKESTYPTASELALETSQFVLSACRGKAVDSEGDYSPVSRAVVKNM